MAEHQGIYRPDPVAASRPEVMPGPSVPPMSWADAASFEGTTTTIVDGRKDMRVPLDENTDMGRRNRARMRDMMAPHVRAERERCLTWNAEADRGRVTLVDRATGESTRVEPWKAEVTARRRGLVEPARYGGRRLFAGADGVLHDKDGVSTGHTHVPGLEPLPWVKAGCPGCQHAFDE